MAKKKQRGFKMFYPGGPLVKPELVDPSNTDALIADSKAAFQSKLTEFIGSSNPPTPNISQPMPSGKAPAIGLGSIGGVLQGVTGLYSTISENLSVPKIQEKDFTSSSKQELLSKATDFKGYEMPKTNAVSSGLSGAASGAAAGTAIAPGIGTVIGAGVGAIGGAVSSIFGNSKRKKAKQRAERAAMNNINAQNTELTEDSIYSSLSSQLADGGSLVEFKNGGSHEENPLGGIPQGYNENGDLNLVEQGETKWNDYIFSNRNKLSKAERFGLPGMLNNRTFSSAAKTIQKESKERPLDLISKRGLNKQMDYLISAQEEHNAMLENNNQFKNGGKMNSKSGYKAMPINGIPKTVKHGYGDWLRYAPVASNVIGLATDIASTPETIQTAKIEAPMLSEKMSYDPVDQEYLSNKLTSNYANLVDKIQGSSGGNRGVANASMIAAMNNLYDAYGDTAIKSKAYNRDMLAKTLEFNRATSQANAQMRMTADQYNANAEDRMIATNAANRAARRNAIREQIAALGENIGAIGTEQRWMDLAPKIFRGYKANGDYSDPTAPSAIAEATDSSKAPTQKTEQPKSKTKKSKKTKEVKNG